MLEVQVPWSAENEMRSPQIGPHLCVVWQLLRDTFLSSLHVVGYFEITQSLQS